MDHHDSEEQFPDMRAVVAARLAARQPYLSCAIPPEDGLDDPRWEIRAAAVHALGEQDAAGDHQALLAALADTHPLVRVAAVRALANVGALDALEAVAADLDWRVREMVAIALHEAPPIVTGDVGQEPAAWRMWRAIAHIGVTLAAQRKVIHPAVWLVSGAIMLATGVFTVMGAALTPTFAASARSLLVMAILLCVSLTLAFLADSSHVPGSEIALATRTASGTVLLCRATLVVGYISLWSLVASSALAIVTGMSWAPLVALWLAPMLTLGALTLAAGALAGASVAAASAALLVALQSLQLNLSHGLTLSVAPRFWSLSPLTTIVTLLTLLIAASLADHPRILEERTWRQR